MVTQSYQPAAPMRLRDRVLRAGSWTLFGYGSDLFFRLLSNLILTRLLFPEAFGAVSAATALITGLNLISDLGVAQVIIQSPRGDQVGFLRSAWVFLVSRSILLWLAIVACCALMGLSAVRDVFPADSIYANQSFALVTASLGFSMVLVGSESTCTFLSIRRLNYKPVVMIAFISRIISLPIIIAWAWIAPSVWALVGGSLAGGFLRLVMSHTLIPGPSMRPTWEKEHFKEIVGTGKWFTVSSLGTFLSQQGEVIFLGILVPGSVLGLYSVAKLLVGAGENLLDRINNSLTLPTLSEVFRKSPSKLRDSYYRFRLPIELTAGFLSGFLLVAGDFLVNFLYDARYAQAGTMLPILALGTAIYPFLIVRTVFAATAETHVFAAISIVQAVSLLASVAIGFFTFGLLGAVGGIAFHRLLPSAVTVVLAYRRNWIAFGRELGIIPAFIAGLIAGKGSVLFASAVGLTNIHQLFHFHP